MVHACVYSFPLTQRCLSILWVQLTCFAWLLQTYSVIPSSCQHLMYHPPEAAALVSLECGRYQSITCVTVHSDASHLAYFQCCPVAFCCRTLVPCRSGAMGVVLFLCGWGQIIIMGSANWWETLVDLELCGAHVQVHCSASPCSTTKLAVPCSCCAPQHQTGPVVL